MNLRKTILKDWPAMLILLLPFLLISYYWDQIPEKIAMHWNAAGEVDGWGEKGLAAFFLPLISVATYLLMVFVPYIDPKRKTDNRQKALKAFRFILPLFLSALSIVILFQWMGYDISPSKMIYLGIAILFLVLGNYMQTLKPNYFIGIRTPWTLESEDNWRKSHRFGGKLWVAGSLLLIGLWFFLPEESMAITLLTIIGGMTVIIVGYSFYLYMKEKATDEAEDAQELEQREK